MQRVQQIWRPGRQSTDRRSMLTPGLAKRDGGARAGGAEKSASCSSTSKLPEALIGGDAAGLAKRAGGARAGGAEKSSSSSSPPNFPDALIGGEDGGAADFGAGWSQHRALSKESAADLSRSRTSGGLGSRFGGWLRSAACPVLDLRLAERIFHLGHLDLSDAFDEWVKSSLADDFHHSTETFGCRGTDGLDTVGQSCH